MTANKDVTGSVAADWLAALAARGVTVTLRRHRLWLHPASASRQLSDDELLTLRQHRQAIKDAITNGVPRPPSRIENAAHAAAAPPPEPDPVVWTRDYARRITQDDVTRSGAPQQLSRHDAFVYARTWLAAHEQQTRADAQWPFGRTSDALADDMRVLHRRALSKLGW